MPPYHPLQAATLAFTEDGVPYSTGFADIYHSRSGAVGQARHVFLHGNDLPQRWANRRVFTILETGFGLGLNFLTTWAEWKKSAAPCDRLHFISLEKFPFSREDLAKLYRLWPELSDHAHELLRQWPWLTPGFHRLHFDHGRVTLTLIFGDALEWLPQLEAQVDAFYLDGFAPSKNPELWSERLFRQVARLSAPDATCASYTVAAVVRQGLLDAGFMLEKRQGFGGKRDMLSGRYARPKTRRNALHATPQRSAVIIGAGIAGSSLAHRLAERDWAVTVIDRQPGPGRESSGNRAGILLPVLSLDDNLQARLSRACFGYALRHLQRLPPHFAWDKPGVMQTAKQADEETRMREIIARLQFPPDYARYVARSDTEVLAGQTLSAGGWWFAQGSWVNPPGVCAANLEHPRIRTRFNTPVDRLERRRGRWSLLDERGHTLEETDILVLANAFDARRWIKDLPIARERRQVSHVSENELPRLSSIICGDGYLTPAVDGYACIGASRDDAARDLYPTPDGHRSNLDKLRGLLPEWSTALDATKLEGRVAYRPGSPDRLPLVGALPDFAAEPDTHVSQLYQLPRQSGLYGVLGFGARGLTWAALCAELLACRLNGEPLPLEKELVEAVDPGRFWLRRLRRNT